MKKTLQINLAGIVFNIEEDAYDKLNGYLQAIQQYFSSYEGSQEIVSDIEARIAEKFWSKQKNDNQQVITIEGVNELIKSMGTVADFEAIEEEEDLKTTAQEATSSATQTANGSTSQSQGSATNEPKKLFRDTRRKALGGVLAGLAHYFNMDVVWLRIIYLVLFFGIPPIADSGGLSGLLFIAYIACWVAFPPRNDVQEDEKIKKFYRDEDDKVLGGVCGGLAAYFGVDVSVIRLLFVISVFVFGTGFLAYIILWIVAPKAETLTQKMEMKGEPVTLENIETNIKQNLKEDKSAPESAIAKILLFPFRMIALLFKGLGTILKSLGPVARIFAGIVLMLVAIAAMFGGMVGLGVFFGLVANNTPFGNFGSLFSPDIHPASGFFAALAAFAPLVALLLAGLILVSNRKIGTRNFWITLLGLWLAGLLGSGVLATKYALNFRKEAKFEQTKNFMLPTGKLVLDSKENDTEDEFGGKFENNARVSLEGFEGTDLKVEQRFEAKGRTREEAQKNAQNITYNISQKDSLLVFDENIGLAKNARFRGQELRMTLFIPYNKPFKMTQDFYYHVLSWGRHDRDFDIDGDDVDKFTYMMKKDSGMVCLDCPKLSDEERESLNDRHDNDEDGTFNYGIFEEEGQNKKEFSLKDFDRIEAGSAFTIIIRKGNEFRIKADSDSEKDLNNLEVRVRNNTLELSYEDSFMFRNRERVRFEITMPELEGIDISGAASVKVIGFEDKSKDLEVDLTGAAKAAIDVEARKIDLECSGAATADIRGSAEEIDVDISGASHVDARKLEVKRVDAQASGASHAKFGKVNDFRSDTSGASSIKRE